MSQKTYCDMCGGEINMSKLNGGMMRSTETYPIFPMAGAPPSQMVQKRIMQEVWDLCESCQKLIWKIAEDKKKELEKSNTNQKK